MIPEELVPVQRIGKMVLNRNPDNFFAETEQVAFHPGHIVPGIDFSNDPLLQGRLFSYTDTQLSRLGSPNFHEIPINRSLAPVHNNQRDAHMRQTINQGKVSYDPNSLGGGCPFQAKMSEGGFHTHEERIDAKKVRARSASFHDHFSQATLFWNSQSDTEKTHIVKAFQFELGNLETIGIRERMVGILTQVDATLAKRVADGLGLKVPKKNAEPMNHSYGADTDPKSVQPIKVKSSLEKSAALSMQNTIKDTIKSRQIAFLVADGVDGDALNAMKKSLEAEGAMVKIVAPHNGTIKTAKGKEIKVDKTFMHTSSVLFDAVFVPGGKPSVDALKQEMDAVHFVNEAFKHCKAIAAVGEGVGFVGATFAGKAKDDKAVILGGNVKQDFIRAIARHRNWEREAKTNIPV